VRIVEEVGIQPLPSAARPQPLIPSASAPVGISPQPLQKLTPEVRGQVKWLDTTARTSCTLKCINVEKLLRIFKVLNIQV
jgi:hypothetical protein